jgi:hypothetical protein
VPVVVLPLVSGPRQPGQSAAVAEITAVQASTSLRAWSNSRAEGTSEFMGMVGRLVGQQPKWTN